jgi:hypothetical protein
MQLAIGNQEAVTGPTKAARIAAATLQVRNACTQWLYPRLNLITGRNTGLTTRTVQVALASQHWFPVKPAMASRNVAGVQGYVDVQAYSSDPTKHPVIQVPLTWLWDEAHQWLERRIAPLKVRLYCFGLCGCPVDQLHILNVSEDEPADLCRSVQISSSCHGPLPMMAHQAAAAYYSQLIPMRTSNSIFACRCRGGLNTVQTATQAVREDQTFPRPEAVGDKIADTQPIHVTKANFWSCQVSSYA